MNKQIVITIRVLEWLYIAAYTIFFLFVGYQLTIMRVQGPQSTIPTLSINALTADAKALDRRFVLPPGTGYTASTSGAFGKSEPFNQ